MGYPLVWQVITSFQEYGTPQQFGASPPTFVGLDNYIDLATDPTSGQVVVRSLAVLPHHRRSSRVVIGILLACS